MIGADDRTLEQAPYALDAVCVNVTNNPFLGRVINPFVLSVGIFNSPIRGHFISVDRFRIRCSIVMDELMQYSFCGVRNDLKPDLALSLNGSDSDSLVTLVTPAVSPHLSAYISFVNFNNSTKKFSVNLAHSSTDTMAEIPSSFVRNAKRSFHLQRRHTFLRFGHKLDCEK